MAALHDGEANLIARTTATGAGPFTVTASGKTTAGTNRLGVVRFSTSSGAVVSGVTWDGVAMSAVPGGTVTFSGRTIYAYEIEAPPTAASNIVITVDAPVEIVYLVTSYNGVDQADAIGDVQTASGSGANGSVDVSSNADDLVVDAFNAAQVIAAGAGQTEEGSNLGGGDEFGGSYESGAATVTMGWTHSAAAWGTVAFSLNAAGATGFLLVAN